MSKFGWWYPAGCDGPPDQEDTPCGICGGDPGGCECPVCSICGSQGDKSCETSHGVLQTWMMEEHASLKDAMETRLKAEAAMEDAWLKADMEDDEAYQASRDWGFIGTMGDYNEHDDSAYQCGKDRD